MNRTHDIEGEFHILPTNLGGRRGPAFSGYRPAHKVHDNYLTSAQHEYVGVTQIAPGETAHAKVWFITPDIYPHCLWSGRVIDVQEGSRVVGRLTVTKILNKTLEGTPERYNPIWVEPQGLNASGVASNG
jgi:translation elongation factor EF-Tu-like GTPase